MEMFMPSDLFVKFEQREQTKLFKEQLELNLHTATFNQLRDRLHRSSLLVERAKNAINSSALDKDVRESIVLSIEQLERLLFQEEEKNDLLVTKYDSLAKMLQCTVLDGSASLESKASSLDDFLKTLEAPSSLISKRVKIGLLVGYFALLLGLVIATFFVIPLIPFTALFTLMGFSGVYLSSAVGIAGFAANVGTILLPLMIYNFVSTNVYEPLCRLFQKVTQEYKEATGLRDKLTGHLSFFTPAPAPVSSAAVSNAPDLLVVSSSSDLLPCEELGTSGDDGPSQTL
jgi:hypothetical protein